MLMIGQQIIAAETYCMVQKMTLLLLLCLYTTTPIPHSLNDAEIIICIP